MLMFPAPGRAEPRAALTLSARRALDALPSGQMMSVIVHLADDAEWLSDLQALHVISTLRAHAETSQAPLLEKLRADEAEGRAGQITSFWIFNGLAVTASRDVILQLAARPDVARVALDEIFVAPHHTSQTPGLQPAEDNLKIVGAPSAWARGITGEGAVVALLDTGVDMSHPELAERWRGGANSWFDATGEYPDEPFDVDGHGTQVLGVILGGDAGGSHIGVAPEAKWIAARIFDKRNRATTSAIHQALQWALDPDGDPATPDAPQVVNNSWSFINSRCDDEFADDLRALRAAGILPVFAAGVSDSLSPANTADAFAVGALAGSEILSIDSPRGPSVCDDVAVFPQIVAPGENIRTTDRFGLYVALDGTSLAAAHVSGALALLLSADPSLTVEEQKAILTETAVDLGDPGPDNTFGYGRLDIAAALDRVLGPDPTRPTATAAATPGPRNDNGAMALPIGLAGALAILLFWLIRAWRQRQRTHHGNQ
jgi:subtilisin family serine protease